MSAAGGSIPISGPRKAAVLLAVLGEEAAGAVLRQLGEKEVQAIAEELVTIDDVPSELAHQVLEEFHRTSGGDSPRAWGGPGYVKGLLSRTFGEETSNAVLRRIAQTEETGGAQFHWMLGVDPQQIAKFLEEEHPQTIALVLAHLDARLASSVLLKLPDPARSAAVRRLAELRQFSPDTVKKIATVLRAKVESLGEQSRRSYSGVKSVADLMNRMAPAAAGSILEAIERDEPKLAVGIRNLMFTFEDFLGLPEASLREWVGAVDKKTLALALKGASEELKNHIFRAMSSRAVEMLKEDMEVLGPVRAKDVAKAQEEAVATARQLEADGKLVLKMEGDDEYLV
jgi:flagellar motor switch protein FliG